MHHNLLLAWLAAFFSTSFKKAANQANSKVWCINYTSYVFKNLLNLLCMLEFYTILFSSWPHSDFTPLSHSVTCTFLASPFLQHRCFWDRISHISATSHKNACIYFVGINCLFREFLRGLYGQMVFYTGSLQDSFHCNSPSEEQ